MTVVPFAGVELGDLGEDAAAVWRVIARGPRWGMRLKLAHERSGLPEAAFADAVWELLQRTHLQLVQPDGLGYAYLVRPAPGR
jgi:hypothetical protein